jgi:hypothetical protein
MSNASSASSMAQQLFLRLGVATAALLLHVSLHGRSVTTLSWQDFTLPFVITGILAIGSSLIYLWLDPNAGAEVSGRRGSVAISRTVRTAPDVEVAD